jgi:hypothetical protein
MPPFSRDEALGGSVIGFPTGYHTVKKGDAADTWP